MELRSSFAWIYEVRTARLKHQAGADIHPEMLRLRQIANDQSVQLKWQPIAYDDSTKTLDIRARDRAYGNGTGHGC